MTQEIVSRQDGIRLGLNRYYTGRPCKRGHLAERVLPWGDCVECRALRQAIFWEKDRPNQLARLKAIYEADREHWKAAKKKRYYADPAKHVRQSMAWKRSNPDKRLASDQKNAHKHRGKRLLKEHKRRAMKRNAEADTITPADIAALRIYQRNKCAICRCPLRKFHVDHITALSRGGTHTRRNLQLLCAPCNLSKGARDPLVFAQSRGLLL